jgi:CBS domain-containing protein
MTLQQLLDRKNTDMFFARPSDELFDAIESMCQHQVGSLLVRSDAGDLLGIITERDILRFCSKRPDTLKGVQISDVMTRELIVATPDVSTDDAMSMMTDHRFRHLPIMDKGKPVGVISIGDLVKHKLKDVSVEVKYLRDYISA